MFNNKLCHSGLRYTTLQSFRMTVYDPLQHLGTDYVKKNTSAASRACIDILV